jgi:hypothetical protein
MKVPGPAVMQLIDSLKALDVPSAEQLVRSKVIGLGKLVTPGVASSIVGGPSSQLWCWKTASGTEFAVSALVYQGRHLRAELFLRRNGSRSPNTCEGSPIVSTVLRGAVECKELYTIAQPEGHADRGHFVQRAWHASLSGDDHGVRSEATGSFKLSPADPDFLTVHHDPQRLSISTKFTLTNSRALECGSSGILTMKALKDSLELRITVIGGASTDSDPVLPSQPPPMYFWKVDGAINPGVPSRVKLSSGNGPASGSAFACSCFKLSAMVARLRLFQVVLLQRVTCRGSHAGHRGHCGPFVWAFEP